MTVQIHWVPPLSIPSSRRSRSCNRHAPLALAPAERVLQLRGDIAAQLSVTEILQFDRDSHPIAILSKTNCPASDVCIAPARSTGAPR